LKKYFAGAKAKYAMKKYWPLNLIGGAFLSVVAVFLFIINFVPQKGLPEDIACGLVFSGAFIVGAALVTALLCRCKTRREQRISYTMVWLAAFVASVITLFSGCLIVHGIRVFTISYWNFYFANYPMLSLICWLWGFTISVLVALGVIVYYKRQEQRNNSHIT
jgi:hypothetical protein